MDWYAIQVLTGKEQQVINALKDYGAQVMQPLVPLFLKSGSKLRLVQKPLMPGYVFASLKITDFYKYKRSDRIEKMMIRLCGNLYEAVELSERELQFLKSCNLGMKYLKLDWFGGILIATNPPPWVSYAHIDRYFGDKFKAKLTVNINGNLKNHSFIIAAFLLKYNGISAYNS